MAEVGIIGWGVVGQATGKGFATNPKNQVLWHDNDKNKKGSDSLEGVVKNSEFIFICVPTPVFSDESGIDLSIVEDVVDKVASVISGSDQILIIKSSVIPGTTKRLAEKYPNTFFAMNPEFLTEKNAERDFLHPDRTIIGAFESGVGERIEKLYNTIYPEDAIYYHTDPTSAELAKYMSNLMLVAKALLANEFYTVAQSLGADYDRVRQMVEADPRIGTHLRVPGPDGDVGFGGKCFPKDMMAFLAFGRMQGVDLSALKAIWEKNLKIRKNRDWEEIPGAVNHKSAKAD